MTDIPHIDLPNLQPLDSDDASIVRYSFACDDTGDLYDLLVFDATEELGRPYQVTASLRAVEEATDARTLLGRNVRLTIERGSLARSFCGITTRVVIHDDGGRHPTSTVDVRPALEALALTRNTRIFQDKTVPQILHDALDPALSAYGRTVDSGSLAPDRYATRDYCVQYGETDLDFVHRLMEEEGIGYLFEHEDVERLVLFDSNRALRPLETMDGEPVPFETRVLNIATTEPVTRFDPSTRLASTMVTVRDHDWARGMPRVEEAVDTPETRPGEKRHEVYEHGFERHLTITENHELLGTMLRMAQSAIVGAGLPMGLEDMVHDVPGIRFEGFTSENSAQQSEVRHELLRRDAQSIEGAGAVTGFAPGRKFGLIGHPALGGDYYVTRVSHTSTDVPDRREQGADGQEQANYHNRFECLSLDVPWRPDRRTAKPRIYGVQTATVTGPVGMDIYTDGYGRIRVKFNWDRSGDDPRGHYSCWLRVAQTWAGSGFPGVVFIPRVGMEVIVSFIDGDPDRPLAMGCVYNGRNPTPGLLPMQATKSILRTRTVPHSDGYNELSFEDAMGMERVHIRAQRDLDELVLRNRETRIEQDQFNSVGANQHEEVALDQRISVGRHRYKRVAADERETTVGDHHHSVGGSQVVEVGGAYERHVENGSMLTRVPHGDWVTESNGRIALAQSSESFLVMTSEEGERRGIFLESQGAKLHLTKNRIELRVGASSLVITPTHIQANDKTMPSSGPQPEPDPPEWGDEEGDPDAPG